VRARYLAARLRALRTGFWLTHTPTAWFSANAAFHSLVRDHHHARRTPARRLRTLWLVNALCQRTTKPRWDYGTVPSSFLLATTGILSYAAFLPQNILTTSRRALALSEPTDACTDTRRATPAGVGALPARDSPGHDGVHALRLVSSAFHYFHFSLCHPQPLLLPARIQRWYALLDDTLPIFLLGDASAWWFLLCIGVGLRVLP